MRISPAIGAAVSAVEDRIKTLNEAMAFFDVAAAYHTQADLLLEVLIGPAAIRTAESGLPIRHLYSHAIELYLKAFLRSRGIARVNLRQEFGHKLGELYAAARDKTLSIQPIELMHFEMVVDRLKNGHEDYEFRYFEGSISTVDPAWIQTATRSLSQPIRNELEALRSALESEVKQQGHKFLSLPSRVLMSIGGPVARVTVADEPSSV